MLIDWFTVFAQVVNFLILIVLLRRFLYGPIIKAMDEREARITADLAAAEEKRRHAAEQIAAYERKNAEIEAERSRLLEEARAEADARRHKLTQQAHGEVEAAQARWYQALQQEQEAFLQELNLRVSQQAAQVMRRALADLADAELEERIVAVFGRRLAELDETGREALRRTLESQASTPWRVYSAFSLPPQARQQVEEAVATTLDRGVPIDFEVTPDLLCGIELRANGYKVSWSIADYLEALEAEFLAMIQTQVEAEVKVEEGVDDAAG